MRRDAPAARPPPPQELQWTSCLALGDQPAGDAWEMLSGTLS
jgi:hypothetical protein